LTRLESAQVYLSNGEGYAPGTIAVKVMSSDKCVYFRL